MREDVCVVLWRNNERCLELARQIGIAIDRLDFGFRRIQLDPVEPDLVVSTGRGCQVTAKGIGMLQHLAVHSGQLWQRWRHYIAIDITTGRDRVHHGLVDRGNRCLQITLDDAMKLDCLTCREPDRAIRVLGRDAIEVAPLAGCQNSARDTRADHEAVRGLQFLPFALTANIAVILLIDAMKLQQLRIVMRDRACQRITQTFCQRTAQVTALRLDTLDVGEGSLGHQ